jgi:hypothetical protein
VTNALILGAGDIAIALVSGDEVERALWRYHVTEAVREHNRQNDG